MIEARLPCPVCLGVKMEKLHVGALALDACRRCGGVWFELGEVQHMRRHDPTALLDRLPPVRADVRTACHGCHTPLDRSLPTCGSCGEPNQLHCPSCARPMRRDAYGTLVLDVCESCKGVWFDRGELDGIWRLEMNRALARRDAADGSEPAVRDVVLFDALFWAPDLVFYGMAAGVDVAGAAAGAISHLPEAAAGAAEVVGEAAGSVFATIAEIIGSIFG